MELDIARDEYKALPTMDIEDDGDREEDVGSAPLSARDGGASLCSQLACSCPDVEGDNFNLVVGLVIIVNAVVLGMETDMGPEHFVPFEHFFAVFFTCEMVMRLCQLGVMGYLTKVSNLFDCLLVCTGDFDLWIAPLLEDGSDHAKKDKSTAKMMKLLRMFRVMRIVRLFKMFHQLQIILEAFIKALNTVCWVGLLTIILNYICAVFLTQTVGHNAEMWGEKEPKVSLWFGTIGQSMRTLFIIITLAEWDEIALVISEQVNGLLVFVLAMAYITITAFTMVSLITGIISEELVGAQRDDEVSKLKQIEKGKSELVDNVRNLLASFDDDNSGTLAEDEIERALANPELKLITRLQALDIDMEKDDLIALLDRIRVSIGGGEVPIDDVVQALKHLSGSASASSVWDLRTWLSKQFLDVHVEVNGLVRKVGDVEEKFDQFREDFRCSGAEAAEQAERFAARMQQLEERLESESRRTDERLDRIAEQQSEVIGRLDRLEEHLGADGPRISRDIMERLDRLHDCLNLPGCHRVLGAMTPRPREGHQALAANGLGHQAPNGQSAGRGR